MNWIKENWFKLTLIFLGLIITGLFTLYLVALPLKRDNYKRQQDQLQADNIRIESTRIDLDRSLCLTDAQSTYDSSFTLNSDPVVGKDGIRTWKNQYIQTNTEAKLKSDKQFCLDQYPAK